MRAFRARRLGILTEGAENEPPTTRAAPRVAASPKTKGTTGSQPPPETLAPATAGKLSRSRKLPPAALLSAGEFCRYYGVDLPHARCVTAQARLLFDALKRVHKLPKKSRGLLRWAAMLATVGATSDPEHPSQAGRDLILARPLRGVSTAERLTLACIVAFSGGKVRADREPTLAALDKKARGQVVALAALVRLAEALDFSRTQTSEIEAFEDADGDTCVIVVAGPSAALDAAHAQGQSDLWYQTFKQELVFAVSQPASEVVLVQERDETGKHSRRGAKRAGPATALLAPAEPPIIEIPPIAADDPMSEAGRKVIYLHFTRMLANEAGTRLGEDPEALHDMRVATRRMRAAFALFGAHFDEKTLKRFGKGLRRPVALSAQCAIWMCCWTKRGRTSRLSRRSNAGSLDPLLAHWETARDVARRQMLDYLDGSAYREFAADFDAFLTTPGAGALSVPEDEPLPSRCGTLRQA